MQQAPTKDSKVPPTLSGSQTNMRLPTGELGASLFLWFTRQESSNRRQDAHFLIYFSTCAICA